ncbi:MAG: hypothetical protein E7380_04705 [Clostridiales bacterium]|nr:hypothetical protein [Clostridiales bacterium]
MMKRLLSIWLAFLLAIFMGISLVGCESEEEDERARYCDPRGKVWYNEESLPNVEEPFEKGYDGSCYIQIDKEGNVLFKPLDGEEMRGTLTTSKDELLKRTEVSISLENGGLATGDCWQNKYGRDLWIWYNGKCYYFDDKQKISKEEFEEYRGQFVDFLLGVYETGIFPTEEEIAKNELYRKFTHYMQIDPCCGGPITYSTVEKATIKRIYSRAYEEEVVLEIDGKTVTCSQYHPIVALITQSGEIKELSYEDVRKGDCLVRRQKKSDGTYSIEGIFYIEEAVETPDKELSYATRDIEGTLNKDRHFLYFLYEDMITIIRTKEELEEVFRGIEVEWNEKPIWERYSEDFFETQSLIFFVQIEIGQDTEMELDSIGLKDNVATVYVTKYTSDDREMTVLWELLHVPKEELAGVEDIKIQSLYL